MAMMESVKEVCGSVRVGEKNQKRVWWNDEIKAAVRRKEATWKGVMAASDEETKESYMVSCRGEKEEGYKVHNKRCITKRK